MRIIAATLVAIVLSAAAAGAGSGPGPAREAADRAALDECLAGTEKAGRPIAACQDVVTGPCLDAPDAFTTVAIVACIVRETVVWDAVLNEDYRQLMGLLPPDAQEALRIAQRAWIAFRDADCAFPHVRIDGTLARILGASCVQTHTIRRVADLREHIAYGR